MIAFFAPFVSVLALRTLAGGWAVAASSVVGGVAELLLLLVVVVVLVGHQKGCGQCTHVPFKGRAPKRSCCACCAVLHYAASLHRTQVDAWDPAIHLMRWLAGLGMSDLGMFPEVGKALCKLVAWELSPLYQAMYPQGVRGPAGTFPEVRGHIIWVCFVGGSTWNSW